MQKRPPRRFETDALNAWGKVHQIMPNPTTVDAAAELVQEMGGPDNLPAKFLGNNRGIS